jgi:4-amino-4-deoxy-L-arabinose transferase-like glycosyltransferase
MSLGAIEPVEPRGSRSYAPRFGWANWQMAVALIALTLILRLIYLIWFSPYELLGDESYYWEQARHFDLCYNEKGPVLAWMIAACCRVFGDTEWAVRLPVAISSALAAWGIGRLAMHFAGGDQRVGFFAVLCFLLLPAFQANAQICTQDGILIALWVALTVIGLRLLRRWQAGASTGREWLILWALLGFGVILKQSVLVFLPSLVIYCWFERRNLRWPRMLLAQPLIGAAIITIISSPMIIWNARHGWPMLAHTLGHLGAGGDQAGHVNRGNPLGWTLGTIGGIVGAFGPAAMLLFIWGSWRAIARRKDDPSRWRDRLWLMCAGWPSAAFFILLSLRKPVVPSWPLPSMVPLVVLAAEILAEGLARQSHAIRTAWWGLAIYGLAGGFLLCFPTVLTHLPILGSRMQHMCARFTGHREAAAELQRARVAISSPDGLPPLIVARHYMQAGLYCFYLPGHPTVFTAGKYLGKRSTTFDQWADTTMENPQLLGRTLLLDGEGDVKWEEALLFDHREPLFGGRFFVATNFRGTRADHPRAVGGED